MGSAERKAREKELRKEDILESAERVFFEKGFTASTMDDVAKEAQFSKRTLYMYFTGKEQIYFEIMTRGYRLFLAMLKNNAPLSSTEDSVQSIKSLFLQFYDFSQQYPHYFEAIMEYQNKEIDFLDTISSPSKEECYKLGEEILKILIDLIKDGITKKVFHSELNPEKTALILWSCTLGIFNTTGKKENYLKNFYGITKEELLYASFELLIGSLLLTDSNKIVTQ